MPSDAPSTLASAVPAKELRPAFVAVAALAVGLLVRLGSWAQTFAGGRVWIDGPDGYYHLRRAWLTLLDWPRVPQVDPLVGVPEGGPISWPPLFDLLLASLALPWRGEPAVALETIGALLPLLLGLGEIGALFWVVSRLFDRRAASWAALFAAFLPGIARYSMVGALDHDPLIEIFALLAVGGLAGSVRRQGFALSNVLWTAVGLALLFLTWVGSILHLGLLCVLTTVAALRRGGGSTGRASPPLTLGLGGLLAALATLPWVIASVWTERLGATFIGLSWLHTAALVAAAVLGLALAWWRSREAATHHARLALRLLAPAVLALGLLAAVAWPALRDGLTFFGRGEPFLQSVTESRPLLSLFGGLDLRAPIIRLSLLPLTIPLLLPWTLRRSRGDRAVVLLWAWLGYSLLLALVQARYAHMAALPIVALGGLLTARAGRLMPPRFGAAGAAIVAALVLLPSLPAYVRVPGLASFHLLGRRPLLSVSGMDEVGDYFRTRVPPSAAWADIDRPSDSAVLAPWSFSHWLIWIGRQGTIATPLGPQGQPAFADGVRFYLLQDPRQIAELLERRRVRFIVAQAEIPPLASYGALSGMPTDHLFAIDPASGRQVLRADAYLATVAARLTWTGTAEITAFGRTYPALQGYREVFRTTRTRRNPLFGEVPLLRVYEVLPTPAVAAPPLTPQTGPAAPASR